MISPAKIFVSIRKELFSQVEALFHQHNLSQTQIVEMALEEFIRNQQNQISGAIANDIQQDQPDSVTTKTETQVGDANRVINQGDIYWVELEDVNGEEANIPHPHVILQENIFNHSRIHTVVACALTSNIKRTSMPGNVLLEAGEANLPRQSVVEVSKLSTLDKTQLSEYIGTLTDERIKQILAGIRFQHVSFFSR